MFCRYNHQIFVCVFFKAFDTTEIDSSFGLQSYMDIVKNLDGESKLDDIVLQFLQTFIFVLDDTEEILFVIPLFLDYLTSDNVTLFEPLF